MINHKFLRLFGLILIYTYLLKSVKADCSFVNENGNYILTTNAQCTAGYYLINNENEIISGTTASNILLHYSDNTVTKETPKLGFYINAAVNSGLANAIISCSGDSITCVLNTPKANSIYLNNSSDKKLIQCVSSCKGFDGTAATNIPAYYINADTTANSESYVIECTTNECNKKTTTENNIFINANFKEITNNSESTDDNQLIACKSNGCSPMKSSVISTSSYKKEFFINSGSETDGTNKSILITCTYDSSKTTCVAGTVTMGSASELFFINGYYGTNKDEKNYLIKCESNSSCISYKPENPASGTEYYVHGGADGLTNAIIKVTLSGASKKRELTVVSSLKDGTAYGIYINSSTGFNLIQCDDSGCTGISGKGTESKPTYYKNAEGTAANDTNDYIIECKNTCSTIAGEADSVYLNANIQVTSSNDNEEANKPLIICTATSCNTEEATVTSDVGYYVNAGFDYKLIKCTSTSACEAATSAVTDEITEVYYINQNYNNDGKYLIQCNLNGGCQIYSKDSPANGNDYYINGGSNDLTNAIIKCEINDTTINCSLKNATANTIYINSSTTENNRLIQCYDNSSNSGSKGCSSIKGIGTADQPGYYINAGESPQKILIKCTDNGCIEEDTAKNNVYLNANLIHSTDNKNGETSKPLIICIEDNNCTSEQGSIVTNSEGYYINAGLYKKGSTDYKLIKCTSTSACEAATSAVTDEITEVYYINQNYNNDGKYLIQCNLNGGCQIYSKDSPANGNDYYINGGSNDLTNAIIKCEINDTTINCSLKNATANTIYINSSTTENNRLIQCYDNSSNSGSKGCSSIKGIGTADQPGYYINAGESPQKILIKCTDNGCIEEDAAKNNVYLNANLIHSTDNKNGETSKPLIICTEDNNCTSEQGSIVTNSEGYYINAGLYKKGSTDYKLIKCTSTSACEAATSAVTDEITEVYYINQNYNNDGKYLIQCNLNDGCQIYSKDSPANGNDYYINGGSNDLTNAIIKCEINDTTINCSLKNATANTIYINSSTTENNRLIQCYDNSSNSGSKGCASIKGIGTADQPGYYINAGESPQKILIKCTDNGCIEEDAAKNNVYLNANLIHSTDNKNGETSKPLIICTEDNNCTSEQGSIITDSEGYYINAGLYKKGSTDYKLIKCTSTSACKAATSAVTDEITEVYYINQNYNNDGKYLIQCNLNDGCQIYSKDSPANGNDYYINGGANDLTNAIIKCEINGTTINCSLKNATANTIYINSSTTENNRLIQCYDNSSNSGSKGCSSIKGIGTADQPGYYINAGESPQKILIMCTDSGCIEEDAAKNNVYLNANLIHSTDNKNGETSKPLIICTEDNNCTSEQGSIITDSEGYYVNAGIYKKDSTDYKLIKCTSTSACKAATSAVTDEITEVYYINQNYNNDGKYLIQCNLNDGCQIYSKDSPANGNDYYINGGANDLTNAIIKCEINGTTINCSLKNATANTIYINSSTTENNRLIQCYDNSSNSGSKGCSSIKGIGTADQPGYYINAGESPQKILIMCTDSGCIEEDAAKNNVYLNANLIHSTDNKNGETSKPLIICTEDNNCTSEQGSIITDSEGYYVNAGIYKKDSTDYKLIKCTSTSVCKAATSAVTDEITEVYYINQNYNNDGKYLIQCTSNDGCQIYSNGTPANGDEYYINGGANNLTSAIIKVTISGVSSKKREITAVSSLKDGTAYEIYINSSTGFNLIQCHSSGCAAIDGIGTNDKPAYYKNAAETETTDYIIECKSTCSIISGEANNVYLNANIKVASSNDNGEADKPLIICTTAGCDTSEGSVVADSLGYYINAGLYTENGVDYRLIECTTGKACAAAKSSVTDSIKEVYYINQNKANDGHYLIKCDTTGCSVYNNENKSNDSTEYYIHGMPDDTNMLNKAIIACEIKNDTGECSLINEGKANSIYINSSTEKDSRLIQCYENSETKGCASIKGIGSADQPGYYINEVGAKLSENNSNTFIIECLEECHPISSNVDDIYRNGNLKDSSNNKNGKEGLPLIKCSDSKCEAIAATISSSDNLGFYVNAGKNKAIKPLIKCVSQTDACHEEPSSVSDTIHEVYYKNENYGTNNNEYYLIRCQSDGCIPYKSGNTENNDEYYIYGESNGLTHAIIKASISSGSVTHDLIDATANQVYLNSSPDYRLIRCFSKGCTATDGPGTSEKPVYYVNAVGSSHDNYVIECDDKCDLMNSEANNVFLNANIQGIETNTEGETGKPLILCDEDKCETAEATIIDGMGFYVNKGTYTFENKKYNLIKCLETTSCNPYSVNIASPTTEVFFINGNKEIDGKYLIKCVSGENESCDIYSNTSPSDGTIEYYVHGEPQEDNKLNTAIIKCTISGSTGTCNLVQSATQYTIYINKSTKKLIQCSSTECIAFEGTSTTDVPGYYINAGGSPQNILIKCTDTECVDEEVAVNNVYLNANLMNATSNKNGEPSKPLIICTAADKCTSVGGTINGGSGYYVNAGTYTEKKPLIKCTSTTECGLDGVTFDTGVTELFYINGNKVKDSMYLIKCSSADADKPCSIYKNENTEDGSTTEYYVHGAPNGLGKAIIKVEISSKSTTESLIEQAQAYGIYYNTFTSLLIQCSNTACAAFNGEGTDKIPYYYINADAATANEFIITCDKTNKCKRTNGGNHDVYLNGNLKEDSKNPNGEVDKPLIICTETQCSSAIGTLTNDLGFYINAGKYEDDNDKVNPLIKCTTTTTCNATPVTFDETDITEHYYINGNKEKDNHYLIHCSSETECALFVNKNRTSGKEYYIHGEANGLTQAIIQVSINEEKDKSGENTKESISCILIDGKETQIYLNSSPNHNLIQCFKSSDDSSTGCSEFKGTGEAKKPIYYVNAAVATDDSYNNLLIQCEDTCHETKGAQSNVYLNANFKTNSNSKGDSVNHLIICNEKKCEAKANEVESKKFEYYVNAGAYNANPLIDTLIECSNSEAVICETKDVSQLGVGTATLKEVFFINKNYGIDPTNYVIKCTGENGCEGYASADKTKLTEFYVHGHPDETSKLLEGVIECNFKDTTKPCVLIAEAEKNSIYLNKYTSQLIQCSDEENGCQAFKGTGIANKPVYYLNKSPTVQKDGEYMNLLIECRETCKEYTGDTNQVYLNANFKTDVNVNGDEVNHLIICNDASCNLVSNAVESGKFEYYVNAGASNEILLKDTLIECSHSDTIQCQEKDVTEIVNDTTVTEVFFINKIYDSNYDSENYVICCMTTTGCQPYNSKSKKERDLKDGEEEEPNINNYTRENENDESTNEYYVNGGSIALLEDSLIKCIFDDDQVASCSYDKVNTGAEDKNVYLNSYSNNKVIRCTEAQGCYSINVSNVPTAKQSAYFINSNDKESETVIKCSISNRCEITSEGLNEGNKVFLNANFDVNGDKENQLIQCQEGFCQLMASKATEEKDEFYRNGDPTDKVVLNNDVIKCHKKEGEESVFCELISPKPNEIYLNADFVENINIYQIIICSDQGCKETQVEEASETTIKFYINAGALVKDKLKDTLILCNDNSKACTTLEAKNEEIYINNYTQQLIVCTTKTGCIARESNAKKDSNEYYLNASDLHTEGQEKLTDDLIKCSLGNNGTPQCYFQSGEPNEIYVNGYNPYPSMEGRLIYCQETGGCKPRNIYPTKEEPLFFINSDDHTFMDDEGKAVPMELTPLQNSLIKCRNLGSNESPRVRCEVTDGKIGSIFKNGNFNRTLDSNQEELGDNTNHLIKCNASEGCELTSSKASDELLPEYYINSGHLTGLNDAIIKCALNNNEITCNIQSANINDIYRNSNEDELETLPLIKCVKNGCQTSKSEADKKDNEYYKNSGDVNESPLVHDIIECSVKEEETTGKEKRGKGRKGKEERKVTCRVMDKINPGTYINSNYSPTGDNTQIIYCISGEGCEGLKSQSTNRIMEYYINTESTDITNAVIFCQNTRCEKQTPEMVPSYYVGVNLDEDEAINGLIECLSEDSPCTLKPSFTSNGYYLNAGYNKVFNQTIRCDVEEGCQTFKVDLGYYVNAGNTEKPIIKCGRENTVCEEEVTKECPTPEESIGGDYCFEDNVLKFYPFSNSKSVTVNKSTDYYVYTKLKAGRFPGLKKETSTLYKITPYSINRFYQNGIVMIDNTGKLVDSTTFDQVDTTIYECNEATKICTKKPNCNPLTYMFDSENMRALFCNEKGLLEYATFTGYVIEGNDMKGKGHRISYLIKCENGENCVIIKPHGENSYYENNGYDAEKYALIQCQSNNCEVIEAHIGFYLGHSGQGVIQCTTKSSCAFKKVRSTIKFINSGDGNSKNVLIQCRKNGECTLGQGKLGYYMTYSNELLIKCTGPSSCKEINPNPNYYDNADSTDEKNTIINCEEYGTKVYCTLEATNDGFYMSGLTNILISCKNGSKCKSIKVNNGIFRGAIKNTNSILDPNFNSNSQTKSNTKAKPESNSNSRHVRDYNEFEYIYDIYELDDSEETQIIRAFDEESTDGVWGLLESREMKEIFNIEEEEIETFTEDGNNNDELTQVSKKRENEETYGIIRCVGGKCNSLSLEEVAAIPICEFEKNKCYITLEYSMMESSTTSISAGHICTNLDRSVFYFATDTIVVKPNVIAGVTSTYVYTTTHSNCLEVNDSYNDKYFTVDSNIYILDEGSVLQFTNSGYLFINTANNELVRTDDIKNYNDANVKLFYCNGMKCQIENPPYVTTYYADVNKRILKYDPESHLYSFAYNKDVKCIYKESKCTPNADLKNQEFCITYKGELALIKENIKNRETGDCYKAKSITSNILGHFNPQRHLYQMNTNTAQIIHDTGYYIVNLLSNTTVGTTKVNPRNNKLILYGCQKSICDEYEPEEGIYYYDERAKALLQYHEENDQWTKPKNSGFAFISLNPSDSYIYKFTIGKDGKVNIEGKVPDGYYYTVDNEMYSCDRERKCQPIEDSGYYFTKTGQVYYCVYDSEEIYPTECTKQLCVSGQFYYINNKYYRCNPNSDFTQIYSRHCSRRDYSVLNFPVDLTNKYPENVRRTMKNIIKNNNNSPVVSVPRGKKLLKSVSSIVTNCTYDVEETQVSFDFVCINNQVRISEEEAEVQICSIEQFGYVECIDDDTNPKKCNVSGALLSILKPSIFKIFIFTLFVYFTLYVNDFIGIIG